MKEKPIIFSTEMVRAILEGRKTQTRRIIKPQPSEVVKEDFGPVAIVGSHKGLKEGQTCPYGYSGDLLWVREKHAYVPDPNNKLLTVYCSDDSYKSSIVTKWKPSIHMPKAAARIWLQITDVKVERLQDISEEDAKKEGVRPNFSMTVDFYTFAFMNLWESIYGDGSWVKNPWLWVLTFKVLSTTGKPGTI